MDIQTKMVLGLLLFFGTIIGFFILLTKRTDGHNNPSSNQDKDDLLGTGNVMIATQIKRDIAEIRMEVDKLIDSAIRLDESSREILERLRDQAKDEPIVSYEYKMLVRQILKEIQAVRNANATKDYEYLVGRIIKILWQLNFQT